jgi:ABC-type nitrate/sulfonate/bicarbonate transport system substrate-binding protein
MNLGTALARFKSYRGETRSFSTCYRMYNSLRIGFVPGNAQLIYCVEPFSLWTEHFSTPLQFAQKYYGLEAELIPYPSGTGHMIQSLHSAEIDIGIGLTEAWVAGIAKSQGKPAYKIVGSFVRSPLCWAISTGMLRDINRVQQLRGGKIGVSRIGSGSYVMPFVLADGLGWLDENTGKSPFEFVPLQTFEKLRAGVNDGTVDAFMWEHFTSKRYYDSKEIKHIGEIYTPWASWKIVARKAEDKKLSTLFESMNKGIKHFRENQDEAIEYISGNLDYSAEDAREWLKTVEFVDDTSEVGVDDIKQTIDILGKARVIDASSSSLHDMVGQAIQK